MDAIVDNASLPHARLPGIDHVTLAGSAQGLNRLSVWRQQISPRTATPPHRHDCEEVVLILSGRGTLYIHGEEHPIGPQTTLVIEPDAVHQIVNTGDAPLDLIGIFGVSPVAVCLPDGTPLELPWAS